MRIFCAPRFSKSGTDAVYDLLEYSYALACGGSLPVIKKTPNGKPYFPDRPEVHFSLSHAASHVLCAISDDPVGADIESPRVVSERAVRFFCSPDELSIFDPLDLWVLKESYIKLVGGTLMMVKTTRFSRNNGEILCTHSQNKSSKQDIVFATDFSCNSRLFRIGDCRAAVSTSGDCASCSVELI